MGVKLRKKDVNHATMKSLYLDFYPPIRHPDTGKLTRREFLNMYLVIKPKNDFEKLSNQKTLLLAENVCAKRLIEIQNNRFGFLADSKKDGTFLDFFKKIAAKKSGTNATGWEMGWRYFDSYAGPGFRFRDLTLEFCEEFRDYILSGPAIGRWKKPISENTASAYFGKFRSVLKLAKKNNFIDEDLFDEVLPIEEVESAREFLTIEEFQKLAATPIGDCVERNASIFMVLTGLRFCDTVALTWSKVRGLPGNYYIQFKQQKTEGIETFPISDEAFSVLGIRGESDEVVFIGLRYSRMKPFLSRWLSKAEIIKTSFTAHCLRHTYATLQLNSGTNIYTVMEMLGHTSIKSTIRYLHLLDSTKKATTEKIKLEGEPIPRGPIVWQIHRND